MSVAKPIHLLAAADFDAAPVWGFDLALERQRGADETWVRPYALADVHAAGDELFVGASLVLGSRGRRRGAVGFRVVNASVEVSSLLLLSPRYCVLGPRPSRDYLAGVLGERYAEYFPVVYEAQIAAGGGVALRGEVTL